MQAEKKSFLVLVLLLLSGIVFGNEVDTDEEQIMQGVVQEQSIPESSESEESDGEVVQDDSQSPQPTAPQPRRINQILIVGNQFTSDAAIMNYIPYHVGEIFNPQKSSILIRNLYTGLKRFRNITLKGVPVGNDQIDLYVIVEEKTPLKDVIFEGNKNLTEKEIFKKVAMDVPTIDAEELKVFAEQIKKLYYDKGFQNVVIDTQLQVDDDNRAIATFLVTEGKKSRIRRIMFEGNQQFADKELRDVLFTKEEWILSLLDKTGTFHPERLEADKHMIEQYYQNYGYMQAKVIDVRIDQPDPDSNILDLTFVIEEGNRYTIGEVKAPGNDEVSEQFLLANIPVRTGQWYSRDRISNTIKMMEFLWGNLGYIFAHIDPNIKVDQENKTVDITFNSDIGKKITLNRINIKGNKKTRDKVIRRRISLQEGSPLTQGQMDVSKNNVMNLGYFERQDGVNWKIKRRNDQEADLDLMLQEAKTGSANIQLGFGGAGLESINALASGVNVKGSISDTNLFGTGTVVNLEASWSKDEQTLNFHLGQPWLFDKPISGAMDIYHRRPSYDQLSNVVGAINSKVTGAALSTGFISSPRWPIMNNSQFSARLGGESVRYERQPMVNIRFPELLPKGVTRLVASQEYAEILAKEFNPGEYMWVQGSIEQDKRNHPMHPSRGQKWSIISKVAIPSFSIRGNRVDAAVVCRHIGYAKLYLDYLWFTPLINEQDLVFKLHLFFGLATPLKGKTIPFGELFHIGGDTTVRGFSYGEIGPKFLGDTIGGKKAFFLNAELIMPITNDFSMKGVIFYDGGAGWDNPYACDASPGLISDNRFDYRHSVGFGLRLLRPMPMRIDWGFKLDPRTGEKENEVHFGMSYDW